MTDETNSERDTIPNETQDDFHASDARFRAVFEDAAIGIGIGTVDGKVVAVNKALARIFGVTPEELTSHKAQEFTHPTDGSGFWAEYEQLMKGERDHFAREKQFTRPDGKQIWANLVTSLIRDSDGNPSYLIGMLEDITDKREAQERLEFQATHDGLTKLPNRSECFKHIEKLVKSARVDTTCTAFYIDLDRFKNINEALGHDMGDRVLKNIAQRLAAIATTDFLCRVASDEFVVIAKDIKTSDVEELSERLLKAFEKPVALGNLKLPVSATIGVMTAPLAGANPREIMKDLALTIQHAKSTTPGRWKLYDPNYNARQVTNHRLSAALPAALENEEFFLEYQPIVRLSDQSLYGAEALVRWQHPVEGRIGPDRFIPLADETGLIVPLGAWVLEQACTEARRRFDRLGADSPLVSVNLTAQQLRQKRGKGIVEEVVQILDRSGLPSSKLQLELTESTFVGPSDSAIDQLEALAKLGIKIAIDDFGTGYSNMSYLDRLPIHNIKLDGSFTSSLHASPRRSGTSADAIVSALIQLSHTLNFTVTAEGIESLEQANALRDLNCDFGQGYLFGRPNPRGIQ